ncbi:MAG: WG repeat-containing protein [Bacteroidetes bacterium]|nr:WG repeat-containing protein [Bacteroidota bacterium]
MPYFCFSLLILMVVSCAGNPETVHVPADSMSIAADTTVSESVDTIDTLVPAPVDSLYRFSKYKEGGLIYGYKNRAGEVVIKPQFEVAGEFYRGLAPVVKGTKHGLCDTSGKWAVVFDDFKFAVWSNDPAGCYEFEGIDEGFYAVVNEEGKYAYANARAELITSFEYTDVTRFSEGKAVVYKNERAGFIDTNGAEVIDLDYEYALPFSEGLAAVRLKGKMGFIDHSGKLVIPAIYQEAYYFSEGFCAVTKSTNYSNYFYIDKTGKTVIPGPYEDAGNFENGEALVQKRGICRVIDASGKELRKLDYDCFGGC